jgi:S1-C subfamily serine protease
MSWDQADFLARLAAAVERFDREEATRLTGELIAALDQDATVEPKAARTILQSLRRKCFFDLMERAAGALRRGGQDEPQIRRQYAQALADQGKALPAIDALEALAARTEPGSPTHPTDPADPASPGAQLAGDPAENAEARGLLGRVYKQLYVDAANADGGAAASPRARRDLDRAVAAYHGVYLSDPARHLWHGINVVALVCRARRDGVELAAAPDPAALARDLMAAIAARGPAGELPAWDLATAAEACVALDRTDDALLWIARYVQRPESEADAFELASTLRQLTEVWRLSIATPPGSLLIPLLQSALLRRKGGRVDLDAGALGATIGRSRQVEQVVEQAAGQPDGQAAEQPVEQPIQQPVQHPAEPPVNQATGKQLEKILGRDGVVTLRWYRTGLDRCRTVAQIQTRLGDGVGTGFLVRGGDFSPGLAGRLLLLTNAHVVSDDAGVQAEHKSLDPAEAQVVFEDLPEAGGTSFRVARLLWTSPPGELDATLLALDPPLPAADCFPLSPRLPVADGAQKVYVIGHPGGRSLSLSLHDNLLLDHDGKRLLHYRAPTEGGSSGSPVFNQQWDLIGLHHAGSLQMPRLNGQPGTYAANEGIWIQRILRETQAAGLRP